MRVLHTSDWHIGAELEGLSRAEEHRHFFSWLAETIRSEEVDVLVVAGDVFHHENPSSSSQQLWYQVVLELSQIRTLRKIVVVGGNHDSAARLEAPRELLSAFRVDVVGGWSAQDRERSLIPVTDDEGVCRLVIAAVPYVSGHRLGVSTLGKDGDAIRAQTIEAFSSLYGSLADEAEARWPGVARIATGHLTCVGSSEDDWQTPIHHVGTIEGLPGSIFGKGYAYVALGHIHRGYPVEGSVARYSGSPIALRFTPSELSERKVVLVDVGGDGSSTTRTVAIPPAREVRQLRGTLDELKALVRSYRSKAPLGAYLDLVAYEVAPVVDAIASLQELATEGVTIVSVRFENPAAVSEEALRQLGVPRLSQLTPERVFQYFFTTKFERDATEGELLAFNEAVEAVSGR